MDIENKKRISEYNKRYYQKNREILKQKSLERYKTNNDHCKEKQKEYYYKKSEGVRRRRTAEQMKLRIDSIKTIKFGNQIFVLDELNIQ